MKTMVTLLASTLLFSGCGGYCWARCPQLKDQLERDFAVLPQAIDCNSELWTKPRDCSECNAMLVQTYGVSMVGCNDTPYLQPR